MTPKEKAEELVDKFYRLVEAPYDENAKEAAMIAVDEIIKEHYPPFLVSDERYNYWQQVKKEIELL